MLSKYLYSRRVPVIDYVSSVYVKGAGSLYAGNIFVCVVNGHRDVLLGIVRVKLSITACKSTQDEVKPIIYLD